MGKKNNAFTAYLRDSQRLADLYNGCLYGGRKEISPLQLGDIQRTYDEKLPDRYGQKHRISRERDITKVLCRNDGFVILSTELQENSHYLMPLRMLEYDILDLHRQVRRLQNHYRREGGLTKEEYLSGIKKTDRLIPAVTILLYHEDGTWNAAEQLTDLLDVRGMDNTLYGLLPNYQIHLFNLAELYELHFETGLRELIGMMKRKDDKLLMQAYCRENADRFCRMDEATYDLICTMLNLNALERNKEKHRNAKEETLNMCKAFDDMVKDGIEIGKKQGRKIGEERMSSLILLLTKDGREKDIVSAAQSARKRQKLYQEYGI